MIFWKSGCWAREVSEFSGAIPEAYFECYNWFQLLNTWLYLLCPLVRESLTGVERSESAFSFAYYPYLQKIRPLIFANNRSFANIQGSCERCGGLPVSTENAHCLAESFISGEAFLRNIFSYVTFKMKKTKMMKVESLGNMVFLFTFFISVQKAKSSK